MPADVLDVNSALASLIRHHVTHTNELTDYHLSQCYRALAHTAAKEPSAAQDSETRSVQHARYDRQTVESTILNSGEGNTSLLITSSISLLVLFVVCLWIPLPLVAALRSCAHSCCSRKALRTA